MLVYIGISRFKKILYLHIIAIFRIIILGLNAIMNNNPTN